MFFPLPIYFLFLGKAFKLREALSQVTNKMCRLYSEEGTLQELFTDGWLTESQKLLIPGSNRTLYHLTAAS